MKVFRQRARDQLRLIRSAFVEAIRVQRNGNDNVDPRRLGLSLYQ